MRRLFQRQAAIARQRIGDPMGHRAPRSDRTYSRPHGNPLRLVMLGDSIAAGLGADDAGGTLGARLAKSIARATHRSVDLTTLATVGARSPMLPDQLAKLADDQRVDVAAIVVGGNDITHEVPLADSCTHLADVVRRLRARGAVVVVGTCPDLGALRPVPQPLRTVMRTLSRRLAAAQSDVAVREGAYAVDLARVVGRYFVSDPGQMFARDRFHPSTLGYQRSARALAPSILHGLGVAPELPPGHRPPLAATDPA